MCSTVSRGLASGARGGSGGDDVGVGSATLAMVDRVVGGVEFDDSSSSSSSTGS